MLYLTGQKQGMSELNLVISSPDSKHMSSSNFHKSERNIQIHSIVL